MNSRLQADFSLAKALQLDAHFHAKSHVLLPPLRLNAPQPLSKSAGRLLLRLLISDQCLFWAACTKRQGAKSLAVP